MKTLWNKWNDISLIKRILVFLIIGAILGVIFPNMDGTSPIAGITILGSLFVGALKAVAPILVFFLVIAALANAHADGSMKTIIIMYVFGTFISALVAVIASQLFPIELTLSGVEAAEKAAPSGITEVLETLLMNVVANPVDSLANANYLGILAWGILIGVALRAATEATKAVFTNISDAIATVVRWIISFAPFGIFGLVYDAVSTNGIEIFTEYGLLLAVLVGCMFFVALVAYPIMIGVIAKTNPYPLVLRCLRESGLTAFFTRSSAANIPVNMTLCFSVPQAILAARAGARYISPFIGRFDDISEDGLDQVANIVTALNNYDFTSNTVNGEQVEVIAASIRSANHVTQAALMGADIATVPFGVLKKMVQHPLTDRGLEAFLKDWEKVQNA